MITIGGVKLFSRDSGGDIVLASYHPRRSSTWHWSVVLSRRDGKPHRAARRNGQWHDYYWLPFGLQLIVSQQDWHKGSVAK